VTITGSGFTAATAVTFGTQPALTFAVNSDTQITAVAPPVPSTPAAVRAHAGTGTVDITVTTPAGTSATSAADRFTYTPPPPPTLTPSAPSVLGSRLAAFAGTVNPNGSPTTALFEYGIDQSLQNPPGALYDQVTPVQTVGSDFSAHDVTARVTGLIPHALYHVRLVASSAGGVVVGPDQTFMTSEDPPPPPPILGKTFDAVPISGQVFIKLPNGSSLFTARDALASSTALVKGAGFMPLTEPRSIPTGSLIDSRAGTLRLVTATGRKKSHRDGTFNGAIFGVIQSASGIHKGLTTLTLKEGLFRGAPSYSTCKGGAADGASDSAALAAATGAELLDPFARIATAKPVLQTLNARDNNGKFRSRGRFSAGTVRGTVWSTSDRCDGTLTTVRRGAVKVFNYGTRKTVVVHAGHSYLAKAFRRRHH
jgi:hypothetical protein